MTRDELHAAAMALPGAELCVQWGDDHIYKVGGKIFAGCDGAYRTLSLKVTEIAREVLIETGRAKPMRYMPRANWVQFEDIGELDAEEARDWIRTSHGLVAAGLTRKARAELGIA